MPMEMTFQTTSPSPQTRQTILSHTFFTYQANPNNTSEKSALVKTDTRGTRRQNIASAHRLLMAYSH
ncbi:hypothetical protein [Dubosiella newyorkensis]|uniref:hypothetical protein n=2 Tax=Dubosiella newyorkensis TaxID=1862672 RepID=UPI00272A0C30|nr:hypothetical protein [Dubosiella newyorkensis]